jgi:hypothetical protein
MRIRLALVIALCSAFLFVPRAGAQNWNAPAPDDDGTAALAEQFAAFAHQALRTPQVPAAAWQESVVLYRAAVALNPNEPRFIHSLADTYLHMGDGPNALKALQAYKALLDNNQKDDQVAQVQIIDLYLADMQGADAKLKYLHQILNSAALAPEIRSEAAVRAAGLLVAKAQNPQAIKMLDTALTLNHVNLAAMRAKFQLTHGPTPDLESVMQLMNMLHASPADPALASTIAQQMSQLGLVDQSMSWYNFSMGLYKSVNIQPDTQFVRGASSELLISGNVEDAAKFLDQYLSVVPGDIDAWFTRLAASRLSLKQTPTDAQLQKDDAAQISLANNALIKRLQEIRLAAGDSTAVAPKAGADAVLPDLSNDPALLQKAGAQAANNYLTTVTALAWLHLYFRHDAAAADPLLNVMGQLLTDTDVQLTRLRGWRMFVGGDLPGATTKLSAIASQDPLAALGLVMININDPAKHDEAMALGKQVMGRAPYGPVGAILAAELRPLGIRVEPQPQTGPIVNELNKFDRNFMGILSNAANYYIIRAEPLKASYEFGEPVLVKVTIQNVGGDDLPIGRDSVLHPDLWFDAFLRGMIQQKIPGAAFDQIGQRLVLKAGQSISTVTRVDTDDLYNAFNQQPNLDITLNMIVVTNPLQVSTGVAKPGPAGLEADLLQMLQRQPTPITGAESLNKLAARLQNGDGGERIRALDAMGVYVSLLEPKASAVPQVKTIVDFFSALIKRSATDPKPAVAAWAQYVGALASPDPVASLGQMAQDQASWQTRLLALHGAPILREKALDLANSLANDKDPMVGAYAKAISQHLATAATQPAAAPASPVAPTVQNAPPVLSPTPVASEPSATIPPTTLPAAPQ